jgi:epoxyqueuosine reductase QueG
LIRDYDVGKGPWETTDHADIESDPDTSEVTISGVYYVQDTGNQIAVHGIDIDEDHTADITVGTAGTDRHMHEKRIQYRLGLQFSVNLPSEVRVFHKKGQQQSERVARRAVR